MTDVVISPRRENPVTDTEDIVAGGWFQIRPSKAYVAGGQWVQPVWSNPIQLTGAAVTVKLDPLPDVPYELYMELPNGRVGPKKVVDEYRIVVGAGPVGWETLVQVDGPGGGAVLTSVVDARLTALETGVGGISGGASNVASITDMSPFARLLNKDTTASAMRTRLVVPAVGDAPAAHTHVATTDLTATGTKSTATFLRGDDTWAVPPAAAAATWPVSGTPSTFPPSAHSHPQSDITGLPAALTALSSAVTTTGNNVVIPGAVLTTPRNHPVTGAALPAAPACCVTWPTVGLATPPTAFDPNGDIWFNKETP